MNDFRRIDRLRQTKIAIRGSDKHLIVGIDIAKNRHYAFFGDATGKSFLRKFIFDNTIEGLSNLLNKAEPIQKKNKLTEIVFGLESTANYHKPIAESLIKKGYNVLVSRTFSKVYGLAGMRLGYAIADPSIIKELRAFGFRNLGINQAVFAGGIASLEDEKHVQKYKRLVSEGKEYFYSQFDSMGLKYIPSTTPFLMVKVNMASRVAIKKLASKNVFVRKGEDWQMPEYLRITMGFPEENNACISALKSVLGA